MYKKNGFRFIIIFTCMTLLLAGCSSSAECQHASGEDLGSWRPNLLYLSDNQYDRLYVEIDAVEGSQPRDETIEALQDFLSKYCDKPGSIKIVQDKPISLRDAVANKPEILALNHMTGPPADEGEHKTAYLHILFYNSSTLTCNKKKQTVNPYMRVLPYPSAIYVDMNYIRKEYMGALKDHEEELVLHEVGHVLGLRWGEDNPKKNHCPNKSCLMHERYEIDVFRLLTFQKLKKKHFCKSCRKYLENKGKSGKGGSADDLKFIGPLLVRSEKDYHVIALPSFVKLYFGELDSIVWQDIVEEARIEVPNRACNPDTVAVVMDTDNINAAEDMLSLYEAFATVENDPYRTVRLGVNMIKNGLWKRYGLEYLAMRRRKLAQVDQGIALSRAQ